jgi:quercetin dioxygenase-like cupin family protein
VKSVTDLLARFEADGYHVSMHLFAPGTVFGAHCLWERRIDAVVCGQLKVVIGGNASTLSPGDWIEIPAGVTVSAEVIGDEPVLGIEAARNRHGPKA